MSGMNWTETLARELAEAAAKGDLPISPHRIGTFHDWSYDIAGNFCWRCRYAHRSGTAIIERHAGWLQANVTFEAIPIHAATA